MILPAKEEVSEETGDSPRLPEQHKTGIYNYS
jgi:hypothetical protein